MRFEPLQLAPVALLALVYARRARTLRARGRPVTRAKIAWFTAGILLLLGALATPVDTLGETRLFWVHMVQHLMLGDLAPFAIVLGLSGPLLRPLLRPAPLRRLRVLAHPLVALPLWTVNLYLWHLPVLYQGALAHGAVHALEHELFFLTGALMWAAVAEPLPGPAWFGAGPKAAYVLVVRFAGAILGSVFIWSAHVFYPRYAAGELLAGVSPHADQVIGGAIMFTEGGIVTVIAFAALFLRWTAEAERRQVWQEAGHDPARARRASRAASARRLRT